MSYEHKEGSGSLFKNNKTKDTQPDVRGQIKIGGVVYDVSGWHRDGQKEAWTSLSVQLPRPMGSKVPTGGRNDPRPEPEQKFQGEEFSDDIPF